MAKKSFIKFIAILIVLGVILIASATVYLAKHLDQFKQVVITKVEASTGRKLKVGDVQMALSLHPAVTITDVSFANAKWAKQPQMLRAASLRLQVDIQSLFSGVVAIDQVTLDNPEIIIETNPQGRSNWDFDHKPAAQTKAAPHSLDKPDIPAFHLQKVKISNGKLIYRKGSSEQSYSLQIDHLSAQAGEANKNLKLELQGSYAKTPFKVRGSVDAPHGFLQNKPYGLDLTVESSGLQLHGKGNIERPMDLKGLDLALNLKADKASSISWLAGSELPSLGPLEASGQIQDQKSGYRVEQLKARIGPSDISGTLTLDTGGGRAKVIAQLTSTRISLAESTSGSALETDSNSPTAVPKEIENQQPGRVFSAEPLPFGVLNVFDADISLNAAQVDFSSMPLQNLDLKLLLADGLLTIKDARAEAAGGSMTADLVINSKLDPAEVSASVHARQVDLEALLQPLTHENIFSGGKTEMDIKLSGQGGSIRALAAGLNGQVSMLTGTGLLHYDINLIGRNLALEILKTLNPLIKKKKADVNVKCFIMHYDIKDGIATTDKGLAFESDKLKLLGSGPIDLKTEQLQIFLSSNSSVAGFLQVGGSLANPKVSISPTAIAKDGASLGVAVMTGGVSMVAERMFDWVKGRTGPCEIARRQISMQK